MKKPIERWLVLLLLAVNAVSVFGFATFGLHPQLLARWSWAPPIFAASYPFFAKLQILVAAAALGVALYRSSRYRWVGAFGAIYLLSLSAELGGTTQGIPFGKYEYTGMLGAKILGHVPWLIPLSWFFMAVPSFALAVHALGRRSSAWARVALASVLLLSWDLTLDPAMSHLTPFWLWEKPGPFYGMPLMNLLGWFVTGVALMIALEVSRSWGWIQKLSFRFHLEFYLANLVLPAGMCVAAGLWLPLGITAGIAAVYVLVWKSTISRPGLAWAGNTG